MTTVREAFEKLRAWLATNAPRGHAALLPPMTDAEIAALEKDFRCTMPDELAALYRTCGGQSESAPTGLFRGYWMIAKSDLPDAWDAMIGMADAGMPNASKDLYPFAKDYAGNYVCFDASENEETRIVMLEDGELEEIAPGIVGLLETVLYRVEDAGFDDTIEAIETFEVLLDAARPRTIGDRITHSVLAKLEIEGTVVALSEVGAGARLGSYGLAVRLIPKTEENIDVEVERCVDGRGRPGVASYGTGSGGGSPGIVAYCASSHPIPEGSRLVLAVKKKRRV